MSFPKKKKTYTVKKKKYNLNSFLKFNRNNLLKFRRFSGYIYNHDLFFKQKKLAKKYSIQLINKNEFIEY
jgi:hypothetical protein